MTNALTVDRRRFLAAGVALAAAPRLSIAAPNVGETLAPVAMRGDLDIVAAAYLALHPGLDRYLGREQFRARVDALKAWASRPRSSADFFVELGRLTAAVRCGHTYPNPVNQSDARVAQLLDHRDRVPFAFRWIEGRMVVTRSLRPDVKVAAGTVIDSIDGTPTPFLLSKLMPLGRADGSNDDKRRALMEVDGFGRFNAFDVYRPLVTESRKDGTVLVGVNGKRLALPTMTEAERKALSKQSAGLGWTFDIGEDRIGVLTMPDWAVYNSKWDWKTYLDNVVDRLIDEKANSLIIDLRDNEGGRECGDYLMERLIERPIHPPSYLSFVRYRKAPMDLLPYLDTWDPSFKNWDDAAKPSSRTGFFQLVRDPSDLPGAPIRPRGRRFGGKIAVLVSPTCSSATFQFANLVKSTGVGKLIGRPTGGNLRGINGGAYFFLRLPGTGFEVDTPLIGYFPDKSQPDAGVIPDIIVPLTRADIAAHRDMTMRRAKADLT